MKFHVRVGKDKQYYVRIVGGNGEPWFISEGYTNRTDAHRSVHQFISAMRSISVFEDGAVEFDYEIEDDIT